MTTSVAMCTYNGANYIREQLDSIIYQVQSVNEIVICDDGSQDNTISILKEYQQKFPQLIRVVINSQNQGYIKNFEKAISLCQNDIIFLSDQDDVWTNNKVKVILEWFRQHPNKDVVFTDAEIVDANLRPLNATLFDCVGLVGLGKTTWLNDNFKLPILSIENRVTGATLAIRKSAVSYLLPFDNNREVIHDHQIALKAAERNKLGTIWQSLLYYRTHDKQNMGILGWYHNSPSTDIIHQRRYIDKISSFLSTKRAIKYIQFVTQRYNFITTPLAKHISDFFALIPQYFLFYGFNGWRALVSDYKKKLRNI